MYAPEPSGDPSSAFGIAGRATVVVDTGEEELTVGGWGAVLEDVEATRITLLEHAPADGTESEIGSSDESVPAER